LSIIAANSAAGSRPATGDRRVAVIDIGSNSIRLEIFDGLTRAFCPLFNEKVICALGRDLKSTGRLSEKGAELALINLPRFTRMARGMGAARIDMLATAAVREAENGAEFIAEVERRCGQEVRVLSGAEEARISALGVLAGIPDADGIMGDLTRSTVAWRGSVGSSGCAIAAFSPWAALGATSGASTWARSAIRCG
jgi:exopolyphosphatase/guanosine-5'-triphosphate,3'-diphosphate pyrophosphatase